MKRPRKGLFFCLGEADDGGDKAKVKRQKAKVGAIHESPVQAKDKSGNAWIGIQPAWGIDAAQFGISAALRLVDFVTP